MMRRWVAVAALAVAWVGVASPVSAGGSWLYPVQDRLEPGDVATFVGYIGHGQLGWVEDGPFFAYLQVDPEPAGEVPGWSFLRETDVPLGQLEITEHGERGWLSLRVAITFTVPNDLDDGVYPLVYCNSPCTEGLGDLIGAAVHVGAENPWADACTPWAMDEPAIADLNPGRLLCGIDGTASAAAVLAGETTMDEHGNVVIGSDAATPAASQHQPPTVPQAPEKQVEPGETTPDAPQPAAAGGDNLTADADLAIASGHREVGPSPVLLVSVLFGVAGLAALTIATAARRGSAG